MSAEKTGPIGPEKTEQPNLLNVNQAADRLGVSVSYLNKLRLSFSSGPPFVKLGARVSYDPNDLAAWVESKKRRSTSDGPPQE